MAKNSHRRRTCRLCHATKLTVALKLHPSPLADEYVTSSQKGKRQPSYPLNLLLCDACGHVQLQDVISPETIYPDYLYETVSSPGLVEHFDAYARFIADQITPPPGSLIVDLGSNDGTLLGACKAQGFRVLGIDPAKKIAGLATQSGITTIPTYFIPTVAGTIKRKYGEASVITANNVFANIDDLDEVVRAVRILLSPTGVFIIETSYLLDCIANMVFDSVYHEHLSYFAVVPLISFFQTHGMEIIDVVHVPTKGGSIRVIVQRTEGQRKISSRVARLVKQEKDAGLQERSIFLDFAGRITKAKSDLLALLYDRQRQHKTLAGYGASNTSTTLLYHYQLERSLPYLFDDNPRKHFTFSPGAHIPVLPSRLIAEHKPDDIVILAWRFAQPIIARHTRYLKNGGHFIIPLPVVRII